MKKQSDLYLKILILLISCFFVSPTLAQDMTLDAIKLTTGAGGVQTYSISLKVLALMTALSFLPALVLMMTSFTRIAIVLSILRQALGMPQTPNNQIIIGLSLFLTFFIMAPVFDTIYDESIKPYNESKITEQVAIDKAIIPIKTFMLNQVREDDLSLFSELANINLKGNNKIENSSLPLSVIIPAFVTSELKTAFQIGFVIFIPFLVIDLVVSSVLMAMGMMMLSPLVISLPFRLMLFVLVDGWNLIMGTLASSFAM